MQFLGATIGKWIFGYSKNLNREGVIPLKNNMKRLLIDIISDLGGEEVVDLMPKRVKLYWGNIFCMARIE